MRNLLTLTALAAVVLCSSTSFAANKTWDGGDNFDGNNFWQTGSNWDADTAPSSGDSLFFGNSSKVNLTNDFAANTSFGGITFNSGIFSHTLRGNAINLSGNIVNLDNSLQTINLNINLTANSTITADHSSSSGNITINGVISESGGSFGITKTGQRTLNLGGNNTFTGGLTISGGVVNLNNAGALNSSSPNAVAISVGGTLRLSGNSVTVSGLSGQGTVHNNHGSTAATLTVNKASGSDTFSGNILNGGSASLALHKTGAGTLILGDINTYSGGTTLSAGTLQLGADNTLGSGGFNFAGGTLNANNRSVSLGALSLTANSTLNLIDDGNTSTLTFSSGTWTAGTLTINGWSGVEEIGGDDDQIFINGSPNQTLLDNIFFDIDGQLFISMMSGNELVPSLTPVPEPTEWALIIFATLAVLYKFVLPRFRKSFVA